MLFANEYEIQDWAIRYASHPILGCAARTLESLVDTVNGCSDGWPYWSPPVKSAAKLITLLNDADRERRRGVTPEPSEVDLRLAYRPIRAFHTRYGAKYGFDVQLHLPAPTEPTVAHQPLALFA
jgi:hypothetical protein